jgi:hypothetical protein
MGVALSFVARSVACRCRYMTTFRRINGGTSITAIAPRGCTRVSHAFIAWSTAFGT